eukprot:gene9721-biopygen6910
MEVWMDGSVVPAESSAGAYLLVEYEMVVAEGHASQGSVACSYSMTVPLSVPAWRPSWSAAGASRRTTLPSAL